MNSLYNLAQVTTATTGTGTVTLGAAVTGWLTFAQAGVPDGAVVTYVIHDDNGGKEIGKGTYTLSGTTLTRTTVYRSSGAANTGRITLSGSAKVLISTAAEDFTGFSLTTDTTFPNGGLIGADGIVKVGYATAALTYGATVSLAGLQLVGGAGGLNASGSRISIGVFAANANGSGLLVGKSRGTVGAAGALVDGDTILFINSYADDGTVAGAFPVLSSTITFDVSGTVSAGIVPGRILFTTMNSAGARATRWSISPEGLLAAGTGLTASFPAFKRSATTIQVRLADDSAYGTLDALSILDSGAAPTGTAGSGYVRKTSPALTTPDIGAATGTSLVTTGSISAGATAALNWTGRSSLSSPSDGVVLLANAAGTDFTRMQLGGTTASFPAWKRSTTTIAARLADDSADAPISAAAGTFSGTVIGTSTAGNKLTDQIYDNHVVATSQLDKTNGTLAAVPGMSVTLVAGKTYILDGWLSTTGPAAGGLKVQLVASGGLSITSGRYGAIAYNGTTTVANTTVTALGTNIVANTAVVTDVDISGAIVVNAGGTLTVQAAQNVSNGTPTSVFANSYLMAKRIN